MLVDQLCENWMVWLVRQQSKSKAGQLPQLIGWTTRSSSIYTIMLLTLTGYWICAKKKKKTLTYRWDLKVVMYPYGLGHYWWRLVTTSILNRDTMISHGIKIMYPLRWSEGHVIMKSVATLILLVEFDICSL